MALTVHRAPRSDQLADGLARLLAEPLPDPFASELVVVPAKGVERWLAQRLSHRLGVGARGGDGVCAGVDFVSPRSLISLLLGRDRHDAWDPDQLVWPLLAVIDAHLDEPWCAPVARHLGHGHDGATDAVRSERRFSLARRVAGLFASYVVQRPELIRQWGRGPSTGGDGAGADTDGAGAPLDADLRWQPELWRRVVALLADQGQDAPDVRHRETLGMLRDRPDLLELPQRLSLFGHTRLPEAELELLGALAEHRDVHIWLPQASPAAWQRLTPHLGNVLPARADDTSAELLEHPLLASLGRDARELQQSLHRFAPLDEPVETADPAAGSLLGWLQADITADRVPVAVEREQRVVAATDASIQVHACHGPARQVEALREVLVGLLQDDPTLQPRDIVIMCPDVEAYAPLIEAAFGLESDESATRHPGHSLRVRLADRATTSTNPLIRTAAAMVALSGGRATAAEVLDLASSAPVRERFGFDDEELELLASWITDAGVRWGLDAQQRGRYGLTSVVNTWRFGLDRLLTGVVRDERSGPRGAVLPFDDLSSGDIDLVGRFTEFIDRLERFTQRTSGADGGAAALADWLEALRCGVADLTDAGGQEWQRAQLDRELARIGRAAERAGALGAPLRIADVRRMLELGLGGRPTRANFRTGTLTVCTMVPMRSVPHRVVCLLGLEDGAFPRSAISDGDDVLARRPRVGERDRRAEDRQLLLDAIMAASEKLVITYTGAAAQTGRPQPPAVPVGELLDSLEATATTASGSVRDVVHRRHPLQPFDRRNFGLPGPAGDPALPGGEGVFSFDAAAAAGAVALTRDRPQAATLATPLPPRPPADVQLHDLREFVRNPVRAFVRQRLNVALQRDAEELAVEVPLSLGGLERYQVGDRILTAVLNGAEPQASMLAELLRGQLPPDELGRREISAIVAQLKPLHLKAMEYRVGDPRSVDIDVDLGGGRRLLGTVSDLYRSDLVRVRSSTLGPAHRLESWVDLLAVTTHDPEQFRRAVTIGRYRKSARALMLGPLEEQAEQWLLDLVDLYDAGMREPLPIPPKTACTWAEGWVAEQRGGAPADDRAENAWTTHSWDKFPSEDTKPEHELVWGARAPYSLLTEPPREDENWNNAPHRMGQYAWRLWEPLLSGAERTITT